jgi:hypothetical protein
MSIKHKYVEPVLIFLAVYLFSYLFCQCGELLFIYSYNYLAEVVPSVVQTVNPIHTPDEYELYLRSIATVGALVGTFLINYISLRLDNVKFEHVITETDGQYTMREGLALYFREFLRSDVIASTLPIALLVAGAYFIPEKLLDRGLIILFKPGASLIEFYGIVGSVIIAVIFSLLTRIASIPLALRTWRALWLSGSV